MKNIQCEKCKGKFSKKDIFTIQQFQYRKEPTYSWSQKFFKDLEIGEWDLFCERCIRHYAIESERAWKKI